MNKTKIIKSKNSFHDPEFNLIISCASYSEKSIYLVVGRPGFPNAEGNLRIGGALLFETPDGLFEVRLMSIGYFEIEVLISLISSKPGIAGGIVDKDPVNTPFTEEEVKKIASSIDNIRLEVSKRSDITAEKIDYINRKLDEMRAASERLGRKDWINLAIGTITSTIASAALDINVARFLFQAVSTALSWLFGGNIKLLP